MTKTAIKIMLTEAQLAELRLRFPEAKTDTETVYRALDIEPPAHGGARWGAGRKTRMRDIPEAPHLRDDAGGYASEEASDAERLCVNWQRGCNGVTDGPDVQGHLTACDECAQDE